MKPHLPSKPQTLPTKLPPLAAADGQLVAAPASFTSTVPASLAWDLTGPMLFPPQPPGTQVCGAAAGPSKASWVSPQAPPGPHDTTAWQTTPKAPAPPTHNATGSIRLKLLSKMAKIEEQYQEECLQALLKVEEAETKQRRTVLEDEDFFWERQVLWESHGEICSMLSRNREQLESREAQARAALQTEEKDGLDIFLRHDAERQELGRTEGFARVMLAAEDAQAREQLHAAMTGPTFLLAAVQYLNRVQLGCLAREWVAQKKRHVYATQQLELACRQTRAALEGAETSARLQSEAEEYEDMCAIKRACDADCKERGDRISAAEDAARAQVLSEYRTGLSQLAELQEDGSRPWIEYEVNNWFYPVLKEGRERFAAFLKEETQRFGAPGLQIQRWWRKLKDHTVGHTGTLLHLRRWVPIHRQQKAAQRLKGDIRDAIRQLQQEIDEVQGECAAEGAAGIVQQRRVLEETVEPIARANEEEEEQYFWVQMRFTFWEQIHHIVQPLLFSADEASDHAIIAFQRTEQQEWDALLRTAHAELEHFCAVRIQCCWRQHRAYVRMLFLKNTIFLVEDERVQRIAVSQAEARERWLAAEDEDRLYAGCEEVEERRVIWQFAARSMLNIEEAVEQDAHKEERELWLAGRRAELEIAERHGRIQVQAAEADVGLWAAARGGLELIATCAMQRFARTAAARTEYLRRRQQQLVWREYDRRAELAEALVAEYVGLLEGWCREQFGLAPERQARKAIINQRAASARLVESSEGHQRFLWEQRLQQDTTEQIAELMATEAHARGELVESERVHDEGAQMYGKWITSQVHLQRELLGLLVHHEDEERASLCEEEAWVFDTDVQYFYRDYTYRAWIAELQQVEPVIEPAAREALSDKENEAWAALLRQERLQRTVVAPRSKLEAWRAQLESERHRVLHEAESAIADVWADEGATRERLLLFQEGALAAIAHRRHLRSPFIRGSGWSHVEAVEAETREFVERLEIEQRGAIAFDGLEDLGRLGLHVEEYEERTEGLLLLEAGLRKELYILEYASSQRIQKFCLNRQNQHNHLRLAEVTESMCRDEIEALEAEVRSLWSFVKIRNVLETHRQFQILERQEEEARCKQAGEEDAAHDQLLGWHDWNGPPEEGERNHRRRLLEAEHAVFQSLQAACTAGCLALGATRIQAAWRGYVERRRCKAICQARSKQRQQQLHAEQVQEAVTRLQGLCRGHLCRRSRGGASPVPE
mmetsp:Transcript_11343/g.20437  ORF Transcript_11343/g.20437 Transcript_11343/m.20437 type:complete len:1228 (-) Transcript_11343:28-3711(-)